MRSSDGPSAFSFIAQLSSKYSMPFLAIVLIIVTVLVCAAIAWLSQLGDDFADALGIRAEDLTS